jgi:hypothetical protein
MSRSFFAQVPTATAVWAAVLADAFADKGGNKYF